MGILCDILMKMESFIFHGYFVILDCEVDFEVPIIFRRPFFATIELYLMLRGGC